MRLQVRQILTELLFEIDCFRDRVYPDFVLPGPSGLDDNELPVFVFHSIEPVSFENELQFLTNNGYRTLTAGEFLDALMGTSCPERSVLLTIDDGRHSVWVHGFPLLQKYGFSAVCFLIPGYVRRQALRSWNLADYWSGRCGLEDLSVRDPELITWGEADTMHRSGIIDFQSHSLYHRKIPTSARITGFYNPREAVPAYGLTLPPGFEATARDAPQRLYGLPVHPGQSLMVGQNSLEADAQLAQTCIDEVEKGGGEDFFKQLLWNRRLLRVARSWRKDHSGESSALDADALRTAIRTELRDSRELLELHLGKTVRHFCFPFGAGSDLAVELANEVGYRTCSWGARSGRSSNRVGDDPFYCPRIKHDYIWRLPGEGRKSLSRIFVDKLRRRLRGEPVF